MGVRRNQAQLVMHAHWCIHYRMNISVVVFEQRRSQSRGCSPVDDADSFTKGLKKLLNAIFRMQKIEEHNESGQANYFVISFISFFWANFVLIFYLGSICTCFAFVSSRFYMVKLQLVVFQDLFNIE